MAIRTALTLAALVAVAAPVSAQGRNRGPDKVPPGHMPPAGMCRIWIDGVPPGRQPKPTNCATARRRVPDNARVIYGARTDRRDDRYDDRIYRSDRDVRRTDDKVASDRKVDDRRDDDDKYEDSKQVDVGGTLRRGEPDDDDDRKADDRDDRSRQTDVGGTLRKDDDERRR
jgi:hypothetical protein